MGILTDLIPAPYRWIAGAALVLAVVIGVRIYWDHTVDAAVTAKINAYIAQKVKDDAELTAIIIADNNKIKIQLLETENTIIKVVHDNQGVIDAHVPDTKTILSNGWVSAFNSSVRGSPIDPISAGDSTPSGVSATGALDTINTNNGIAQSNLAELSACQKWITQATADVAAENAKVKKRK